MDQSVSLEDGTTMLQGLETWEENTGWDYMRFLVSLK